MMKNYLKTFGIVLITMAGMILLFICIVGLGNFFQKSDQHLIGNIVMFTFPILTFIYVSAFNKRINKLGLSDIGFDAKNIGKNCLIGAIIAILIHTMAVSFASIFYGVSVNFISLKPDFGKSLLSTGATLIIVGVWEEFYFRGLVWITLFKNKYGFHAAALISAILFSIIHWSSFDMQTTSWAWYIGIVFLGYLLVYIYTITRSIWTAVSFHFIWNFISLLYDDKENKIGIFTIQEYIQYAKLYDNLTVVVLGIILALVIYYVEKTKLFDRIRKFEIL